METRDRRLSGALLVISIVVAFVAQFYFARKREYLWDGLVLYVVAMAVFAVVVARVERRPPRSESATGGLWAEFWTLLRCSPVRLAVLCCGVATAILVAVTAQGRSGTKPFWDLLIGWVGANALVIAAFVDWRQIPDGIGRWTAKLSRPTPETVAVLLVTLVAFLLRAINLADIPFVLSGDEASMGLEAIGVIEGQRTSPFVTGWLSHPTLYFFLQAAFLRLLGVSTQALRLPSAIVSAFATALLYYLVRHFWGRWQALLASIFFAAYHYGIHFGRLAINNIWDPFFAVGVFYFFTRGLERDKLGDLLVAGLLLGLAAYFYMGSRLIPILLFVYLAYWALQQKGLVRDNLAKLAIFALVAALIALPLLLFFRAHPKDMMARWGMMGIFPSGWVDQEMQRTGRTVFSIVFFQFLKAALAFNYFPDPTVWYRPGIPLLHFVPSVFFVIGFTYAVIHWRRKEYFLLVMWYLLVVLFGGALLENPPTSPRLVLSIPAVVICTTLGMVKCAAYLRTLLGGQRHVVLALSLALVLGTSYQSVHFYFREYTPAHEFGGQNTEVADRMGRYLRVLGPDYQCYFFGPPRMYYGFATIPFLARGVVGLDVDRPIADRVDFVNPDRQAVFVFLPERLGELDVVRRVYPSGLLREFRDRRGQILFVSYEVET